MGELLWTSGRGIIDGDKIWFVPYEYCCLCQYDYKVNHIVEFIFLDGASGMFGTHYSLAKYKNYIILVPTRDMNIFVYDIEGKNLQRIPLKGDINTKEKFIANAVWKHYIYMFPVIYPQILKLDLDAMEIEYIDCKSVVEYFATNQSYTDICITIENIAYLLIYGSNKICEFNMETNTERIIVAGGDAVCYKTMCRYGDKGIILSDQQGNIVVLDENKEQVSCIVSEEDINFNSCIPIMDGYLFIPFGRNLDYVYLEDCRRKKIKTDTVIKPTVWADNWKYATYSRCFYNENTAVLFNLLNRSLCMLDCKTWKMREEFIILDDLSEDVAEKTYHMMSKTHIIQEKKDGVLNLKGLLKYTESDKEGKKQSEHIGRKIHNMMKLA